MEQITGPLRSPFLRSLLRELHLSAGQSEKCGQAMLPTSRPGNLSANPPRRAFTLIELLVTIGIILILVGILFVAISHMGTSAKEKATRITLANLAGMLGDYGSATGFKTEPGDWVLNDGSIGTVTSVAPITSFWTAPDYTTTAPIVAQPLAGPPTVTVDADATTYMRDASPAVLNTLVAMNMICRVPANRTAIANMPPQNLYVPGFVSVSIVTPSQQSNQQYWYGLSGGSTAPIQYPMGCHIISGKNYFVSVVTTSTPPTVGGTTPWRDESAAPQQAPLILDAWGNPIIFVPGSGLNVLLLNGGTAYDSTNTNLLKKTVTSPDHRPFWASAGPDGDFSHGDDNIYSFEQ